jgi:hypothetical protein
MARKRKEGDPADAALHDPQEIPAGPPIDHAALFPGLRARHDGWTKARTQRFLDALGHTGCVDDACRKANMSETSARRKKAQYPAFSAAWDAAVARAQPSLIALAYKRAVEGTETIIIRKGEEYERRITPSEAMLKMLIKRADLLAEHGLLAADSVITFDEWQQNWRFDWHGKKVKGPEPGAARLRMETKIMEMRQRMIDYALEEGTCVMCEQTWPVHEKRSMAELVACGVIRMDAFDD